jgi:hypothetical protein
VTGVKKPLKRYSENIKNFPPYFNLMSLVSEVFAKNFAKDKKVDWQRVVQLLASYNWETQVFDVRAKLSGLEDLEEKTLEAFLEFLKELREPYLSMNKSLVFSLLGTEAEVDKRIKEEIEKKVKIKPFLIETLKKFASELVGKIDYIEPIIFLRGSASPNSPKIFWYYEDKKEKIFISDVDLEFVLPYFEIEILDYMKWEAYKFSLREKIPVNVHFTKISDLDDGIFKYGYPIFIPYRFGRK